jgi:signal transduction histidine kinase
MAWWRVRSKLALVVAIPATAFCALATVQIASAASDSAEVAAFHDRVELARPVAALATALQTERDRTAGEMADAVRDDAFDRVLGPDRAAVDTAYRQLVSAAGRRSIGLREAADRVRDLEDARAAARTGALPPDVVFRSYTAAVSALFELLPQASSGPDAALLSPTIAVLEIARAKEYASQLRAHLYAACRGRFAEPASYQRYAEAIAEQRAAVVRFTASAPFDVGVTFGNGAGGVEAVNLRDRILEQIRGRTVTVSPEEWWQASTRDLAVVADAEQRALGHLDSDASKLVDDQHTRTLRLTALILGVLVITLASWILIGRSMVRSLRELRGQALDVAQRRLPEAIQRLRGVERQADLDNLPTTAFPQLGGSAGDEIEEVGDAFAAVHASAVRLAGEQAELRRGAHAMIINVARRSQALVERQLKLLDEVQSAEEDPDQLANLFRLDHLVTRMRRNDANLLVLAGADTMRRRSDPVPLSAVVLAAMAEIEAYERVLADVDDGGYIAGLAVADVIHILAELLENATRYSPPDTTVTVLGRVAADGRSAFVRIADRGLGMSEQKLAEANEKIMHAGESAPVAAATAQMGLWVVGRLAGRHNLAVGLRSIDHGVQAEVGIPAALLAPPPSRPYAELARSVLRRSTMHLISRELAGAGAGAASAGRSRAEGTLTTGGRGSAGSFALDDRATPPYGSPAVPVTVPAPVRPSQPDERDARNLHGWTQEIRLPAQPVADPADRSAERATGRAHANNGPVVPAPADGGTSGAGLPVRVPMAQLPNNPLAAPPATAPDESDPAEVKRALNRFYRARHAAPPDP